MDTVKFRHDSIAVPQTTPEDKVVNVITKLKSEVASIPASDKNNQIEATSNLRNLFSMYSNTCDAPSKKCG